MFGVPCDLPYVLSKGAGARVVSRTVSRMVSRSLWSPVWSLPDDEFSDRRKLFRVFCSQRRNSFWSLTVANITKTVAKQMLGACVLNQTCPEPTRVFNSGSTIGFGAIVGLSTVRSSQLLAWQSGPSRMVSRVAGGWSTGSGIRCLDSRVVSRLVPRIISLLYGLPYGLLHGLPLIR